MNLFPDLVNSTFTLILSISNFIQFFQPALLPIKGKIIIKYVMFPRMDML